MTFAGLLTAIVTPFRNGSVDERCHRALVERQIAGGVQGLVPVGTTGEAPTLTPDEQLEIVRWTIEVSRGRVPVLAGIGSNDTAAAVRNAVRMAELGVDGVLATVPYYNKPTQEGLVAHFSRIADATEVEVCLYDVPGRSGIHLQPDTVARLAAHPHITALKDATGDLGNLVELRNRLGDSLALLSGDDLSAAAFLLLGGHGTISVASNVVPERMRQLVDAARAGDARTVRPLNEGLFPLFSALFAESNPIPVKAAMAHLGLLQDELRLPLVPMSAGLRGGLLGTL